MVVLLGFPDVQVTKDHNVDWWTNKIGGLPNWFNSVNVGGYPRCSLCNVNLYHLVQVYCPLANSSYHRTLNIFGCTNRKCWNKPQSIVVLRSQELELKPVQEQKPVVCSDDWGMDSTWCEGDDDWGTSSDDLSLFSLWDVSDVNFSVSSESHYSPMNETAELNAIPPEAEVNKKLNNLTITENNEVHTFQDVRRFEEYHLYVQEEGVQKLVGANDYEMKLYDDYVKREGVVVGIDEEEASKGKKKDKCISKGDSAEKYEKTKSKSKDAAFHHFKKTISPYPGQLLRYDWCGDPLLLSSRSPLLPSMTSPPDCPYCQSKRVFELQLMPSLLNYLRHDNETNNTIDTSLTCDSEEVRLEFGCIYVFSCSKACWEGNEVRSEYVVVQPDPDEDVVK